MIIIRQNLRKTLVHSFALVCVNLAYPIINARYVCTTILEQFRSPDVIDLKVPFPGVSQSINKRNIFDFLQYFDLRFNEENILNPTKILL